MSSHEEEEEIFEVQSIIDHRTIDGIDQWKVRWKGHTPNDDTWEPLEHLTDCLGKLEEFYQSLIDKEVADTQKKK